MQFVLFGTRRSNRALMYNGLMLPASPLASIEPRLRPLLPADLHAAVWVDPSPTMLERVFEHLRTLQRILHDYTSRLILDKPPRPGEVRYEWQRGTLMFTDLAGFTSLMEANASQGRAGASALLKVLNAYFTEMIEIISKSGGDLLEFTGDALLVLFSANERRNDVLQAVRAGLRMQRAMAHYREISTPAGPLRLGMRIGIHTGRFLTADIGTPRRMEHVLLGLAVHQAKLTESNGQNDRVCLSLAAFERLAGQFRFEDGKPGYRLVLDDLSAEQLGEYDITPRRRVRSTLLFERSVAGLVSEIEATIQMMEPLASLIPAPVLNLLVESAAHRRIPADFAEPTVVFVNFSGLPEAADRALPGEEMKLVTSFSRAFALINAAVEARGGMLKKVTHHLSGSDIVIYFGVPSAHSNDIQRAASAALAIREIVTSIKAPTVGGVQPQVTCQIGIHTGPAFAAEVGDPHGRREFNVLGDTVNTAARLMNQAVSNQVLVSEVVRQAAASYYQFNALGSAVLKGKSRPLPVFELVCARD
jgi:class 3 adenylate cyclase